MKTLLILFVLTIGASHAQWSKEALQEFNTLQDYTVSPTSNVITLWGGVKRFLNAGSLEGEAFSVKLPSFEKELEIYTRKIEGKAPLMVFFPGIFGTHEGSVSPWIMNGFEAQGFHTASIPNFLSKSYIRALPKYSAQNAFTFDAKASLEAVQKALDKVGAENVDEVVFLGESLGSYLLASVEQFIDDFPQIKQRLKKVVFLWPPLNLDVSLKAFDDKAAASKKDYEDCSYLLRIPSFLKHFWWQERPQGMDGGDQTCFGAYLFHGTFLKSMGESFDAYVEARELTDKEGPKGFRDFVKSYNPHFGEAIEREDPRLEFQYWLKRWEKRAVSIRIASSEDDFINKKEDWDDIKNKFLFNWGEHCAPISLDKFIRTLVKEAK